MTHCFKLGGYNHWLTAPRHFLKIASMTDNAETRAADALDDQDLEAVNGGVSASSIMTTVFRIASAVVPAAIQSAQSKGMEPRAQGIVSASPDPSQGIASGLTGQDR